MFTRCHRPRVARELQTRAHEIDADLRDGRIHVGEVRIETGGNSPAKSDARAGGGQTVSGMTANLTKRRPGVSGVTVERGTAAFGDRGSGGGRSSANARADRDSQENDEEPRDAGRSKRVRIVL